MAGDKLQLSKQDTLVLNTFNLISGKEKAAKMTTTIMAKKEVSLTERWVEALMAYSDYFIRY